MTAVSCLQIIMAKVSSEITFKVLTWRDFKYERAKLKCTYHIVVPIKRDYSQHVT